MENIFWTRKHWNPIKHIWKTFIRLESVRMLSCTFGKHITFKVLFLECWNPIMHVWKTFFKTRKRQNAVMPIWKTYSIQNVIFRTDVPNHIKFFKKALQRYGQQACLVIDRSGVRIPAILPKYFLNVSQYINALTKNIISKNSFVIND